MCKIKVCFLIPGLSIGGGGASVFKNILEYINKDLFEVSLITYEIPTKYSYSTPCGVNHFDLNIGRLLKAVIPIFKLIKSENFDIVISNAGHVNVVLGILRPFLPLKTKLIGRESNIFSYVIRDPSENQNKILSILFYKLFLKKLDKIICQSEDMKLDLIKRIKIDSSIIEVINNPINNQKYSIAQVCDYGNNLLAVGRLVYQKGFDNLLKIASIIDKNGVDFKLKIFGEGAEEFNLNKQILELKLQNKVFLMGLTDNIGQEYANSNLYLMTSRYEGFPNSLLEAISYGLPCVVFDCSGDINEIVNSRNGIIVPQGDCDQFAMNVIDLLKVKNFDKEAIRRDALMKFNVNSIVLQYEELFKKVYQSIHSVI
jgi:glycosyltransferase involved in cell wall biosynthesis